MFRILLFLIFPISFFSQTNISGRVIDKDGKPIPSASVLVQETDSKKKLNYALSDNIGNFNFQYTSTSSSLEIKISAFNYATIIKPIANENLTLDLIMDDKVSEIEEVILTNKMISAKGDTISFSTNDFSNKSDRTLSDILRNMPGFDVDINGKIKYQGRALSNFYVENRELVGGAYGQITQSLPKEDISKIEILENHQAIKVMQGRKFSDSPALNVKLKKSISLTGRAETESGFADPWLWNVKIAPMFFSKRNQWILNYKTNNVGENVEIDTQDLIVNNLSEATIVEPTQISILDTETVLIPSLPLNRFLYNNVHNLSINYLTDIWKNYELRIKGNYTNNKVFQSSEIITQYPDGTLQVRKPQSTSSVNRAKGEWSLLKNTDKSYLKNTFSWNGFWDSEYALGFRLADNNQFISSDQRLSSPMQNFQNAFSAIVPYKNKLINISSYLNFTKEYQILEVSPANYSYNENFNLKKSEFLLQDLYHSNIDFINSVFINYEFGNIKFEPKIGFNFSDKAFRTELFQENSGVSESAGLEFANNNNWKNFTPGAELTAFYKKNNFEINLNVPVSWNNVILNDRNRAIHQRFAGTNFNPSLKTMYEFWNYFKVIGSVSYNSSYGVDNSIYLGKILTSPISIVSQNNPIPKLTSGMASGSLQYRNTENKTFIVFDTNYSVESSNLIEKLNVSTQGNSVESILVNNQSENFSNNLKIGKYFSKIKSNVSINYGLNKTVGYYFYNSLDKIKYTNSSFSAFFSNTYLSWINFNYTVSYNQYKINNVSSNDTNTSETINQKLKLYFFIMKDIMFNVNWDSSKNKLENDVYKNEFFDLSLTYNLKKNNVDFEIGWQNVGNAKEYNTINIFNSSIINRTKYQLRPSQVVLGVKFKFK